MCIECFGDWFVVQVEIVEKEVFVFVMCMIIQLVCLGQMIFVDCGDLVIVGLVSFGVEVIVVGNIYIYGCLCGCVLVGVNGDILVWIFCYVLDVELLVIVGFYLISENLGLDMFCDNVQVFLEGDKLCVEFLK